MMSKGFIEDDKCLFIGGLRRDLPSGKLKSQLKYLFKCINISVEKHQIIIINNSKSDYCYGFVDLQDVDSVKYVLNRLGTQEARNNFKFDYSILQDPNKRLKIDNKKPPKQPPVVLPEIESQGNYSNNGETDTSWTTATKLPFSSPTHPRDAGINAQTSTTGLPSTLSKSVLPKVQGHQGQQLSMATSVSGLEAKLPDKYYRLKDRLGNETRTMEFKQGGFVSSEKKYLLQDNIGKYACAFLNTDGGTLLVGVNDDGCVVGIRVDQSDEDKHRLSIDQAVKQIGPPVLPNLYTVNFVPVVDVNNTVIANLKVLEVIVKDRGEHSELYVFRGDAYIRRDGSVQLLKTREIQEWERKRVQQTQQNNEEVLHRLEVLQNQYEQLQHKKKKGKSRVCVLM